MYISTNERNVEKILSWGYVAQFQLKLEQNVDYYTYLFRERRGEKYDNFLEYKRASFFSSVY